ncbi:MAG TPA: TRAP transporter small permease [Deltaproteobacteria bacterium]|nr:TRAP transporter small permease [Deltaproteobacteria bacterium]HQI81437.1 TRAP transporter small permease [Deltaproteobacteria bacterium]
MERFVARLSEKMNWIGAAVLVFMMLLTVADVIGRLFKSPIPGTFEIVGFTGAAVIAFALPYTSVEKGHIAVDILVERLPWLARAVINAINALVSMALFGVISWQCVKFAQSMRQSNEVSLTLQMPVYPFVYGIAAGCALLSLVLFVEFIRQLRGAEAE